MLKDGKYEFKGVHEYSFFHPEDDDCDGYLIKLNDEVYAFEYNAEDGYRSSCTEEKISEDDKRLKDAIFNFEDHPIYVHLESHEDGYFEGIKLYDSNEEDRTELAQLGTDNADDYYPSCSMHVDIEKINTLYFFDLVTGED